MLIKNTSERFGLVSIILHWVIALLVIALLIIGIYMADLPISVWKLTLYRWHKEIGALVLFIMCFRLGWRFFSIRPTLSSLPRWEGNVALAVHWFFYVALIAMPISGWAMSSASGIPVSFFGLFLLPDLVNPNEALRHLFNTFHETLGYVLIAVISLHAAAAMKHHFIDKDTILERMIRP